MAEQINTVTIPCLVIQKNRVQLINYDDVGTKGQVQQVNCRNVIFDNTDGWAIPIKDNGIFTGFQMVNKAGDFLQQPTYDSIPVFRIKDKLSNYWWWIYGTKADFLSSCATCCGDTAVDMPGIDPAFSIDIAPCQRLYNVKDSSGNYQAVFAIPDLHDGESFYVEGAFNNQEVINLTTLGALSSIDAVVSALNSQFNSVGSPAKTITWVVSGNTLTATIIGGEMGDEICLTVISR